MCVGITFLICLLIAAKLRTGYTAGRVVPDRFEFSPDHTPDHCRLTARYINQRAQQLFRCTDFHCSDLGDYGTEWIDFVSTSVTCIAPNSSALISSPTADDGFHTVQQTNHFGIATSSSNTVQS